MITDAQKIAELERENRRLRKLLADNGIDHAKPPFVPSGKPRRFPSTYTGGSHA